MSTLKALKPSGVLVQLLGRSRQASWLEKVAARAVRVERDLVAKVAAQQLGDGLAQDLARQVPQGDVDAAQDAHLAAALGVGVEHVVKVHLDGQGVLADQAQVRQPAALQAGDDRPGDRAARATGAIAAEPGIGLDLDDRPGCRIAWP